MHQDAAALRLGANIEKIAAYTARHEELRTAHHFLYDLRSPSDGSPEFIVMGINPGESKADWSLCHGPTEETSRHDFHGSSSKGRSAIRWAKSADYFLDGADHVLAEVFFWSSRDMRQFEERFGKLAASPHLAFCRDMNRDLIDVYKPRAIVAPGLGLAGLCERLYGLTHVGSVLEGGVRVVERYSDGERDWLFTKHWTGAFGLTTAQRERIRDTIRAR